MSDQFANRGCPCEWSNSLRSYFGNKLAHFVTMDLAVVTHEGWRRLLECGTKFSAEDKRTMTICNSHIQTQTELWLCKLILQQPQTDADRAMTVQTHLAIATYRRRQNYDFANSSCNSHIQTQPEL